MAKSYFGWKERSIDRLVDWSDVSKTISDDIKSEVASRQATKADLRSASDKYITSVSSIELGDDKNANQTIIEASNQLSEAMLMANRKLNSGEIGIQEYTALRQNLFDGTDGLISAFGNYNKEYSEKMQRYANNESMNFEAFLMEGVEGYANFKDMSVYVNPLNFQVGVAKTRTNPETNALEVDTSPGNIMPMNILNKILKTRYDRYDFDKVLSDGAKQLGKEIKKQISGGYFETVDDVIDKDDFEDSENLFIESILSNPYNASEVLSRALGYGFTWDPEEAIKGKKMLVGYDNNGNLVPKINPTQKAEAEEALRARFRTMLNYEFKKDKIPVYGYKTTGGTTGGKTGGTKSKTAAETKAELSDLRGRGRRIVSEQIKSNLSPQMIDRIPERSIPQLQSALGRYSSFFDFSEDGDEIVIKPIGVKGRGYVVPTKRLEYYPSSDKENAGKVLPKYLEVEESMRENLDGLADYVSSFLSTEDIVSGLGIESIYDLGEPEAETGGGEASIFDELDAIAAEQ